MSIDPSILSVENIRASYHKKEVLRSVSINIRKGEIVSIIGPNGAGKSSLLKVIMGILIPQEGNVYFLNKNVTYLSPHMKAKIGIGYFIQGGEIFPNLTALENLELGGLDLSKSELNERINEIFALFSNLFKIKSRRAGLLSGGEKQLLALGIILIRKPKLLLLDEPSAGLAPSLVEEVMGKIQDINESIGISILLVEQDIKQALKISERVYLLKNGEIVDEENPESLLQGNKIEEIFLG